MGAGYEPCDAGRRVFVTGVGTTKPGEMLLRGC